VVVHVPIKRYGMLWGFQSLHMHDGWMDGWMVSLPQREEGREGGFLGLQFTPTLNFTIPKGKHPLGCR